MSLSDKQWRFMKMLALLIQYAELLGYKLTVGEAYRPSKTSAYYKLIGIGIKNSLHTERLAVDVNLFIDGVYRTDTDAHLPLGEFWEFIGGSWGGRFRPTPDGNHYSLEHNGVK